jgi:hypothetical protein
MDKLRKANAAPSRFAGIPVSIKDLFDIKGQQTRAGSKAIDDTPPAAADATVVARLRRAGFVLIGRSNMVEFAYSGLGLNPHYGTPKSPWRRDVVGNLIERHRGRDREPHPLDRTRRDRLDRLIGMNSIERHAAGDAARQRAVTIERERQRHAAVERNPPCGRLVADDAAIGRRNPAGAAGVGAERAMRHAVGN